jgi:hypothetical protein
LFSGENIIIIRVNDVQMIWVKEKKIKRQILISLGHYSKEFRLGFCSFFWKNFTVFGMWCAENKDFKYAKIEFF